MKTKTPRPFRARLPRRSHLALGFLAVLAAAPAVYRFATRDTPREVAYGQFKELLAADRVLSVKVGPSELTGELRPDAAGGRPARFRASRLGMERDGSLAALLDA